MCNSVRKKRLTRPFHLSPKYVLHTVRRPLGLTNPTTARRERGLRRVILRNEDQTGHIRLSLEYRQVPDRSPMDAILNKRTFIQIVDYHRTTKLG